MTHLWRETRQLLLLLTQLSFRWTSPLNRNLWRMANGFKKFYVLVTGTFKNWFWNCFYEKAYQFLLFFLKVTNAITKDWKEFPKAASSRPSGFPKATGISRRNVPALVSFRNTLIFSRQCTLLKRQTFLWNFGCYRTVCYFLPRRYRYR